MRIVVAGGSGFLGLPLCRRLAADGHDVTVLTRTLPPGARAGTPDRRVTRVGWAVDDDPGRVARAIDGADAVVNLAGESIAARRWTARQKDRIRASRLDATRALDAAVRASARRPACLVNASAVGYYGDRGSEELSETSAPGSDFLARVCVEWEREALRLEQGGLRVTLIRTGIVLDESGGALAKMLPPFRLYAGGPIGSGRQFMSWIHRDDWIEIVRWSLGSSEVRGPVNATAPTPVTNAEFGATLGRVIGRPSWLPAPALALKLMLGEMAESLLLFSQRVLPVRATALGFEFRYRTLEAALAAALAPRASST
jgi:hypothetical protein